MKQFAFNFLYISLLCAGYVYSSSNHSNPIISVKSERLGDQLYVGIQNQPDGTSREFTANSESEKNAGGQRRALLKSQDINTHVPFQQLAIIIPKSEIKKHVDIKKETDAL